MFRKFEGNKIQCKQDTSKHVNTIRSQLIILTQNGNSLKIAYLAEKARTTVDAKMERIHFY